MPPKRKENDLGDDSPSKKTKSKDDEEKRPAINVNWAIPKEKNKPTYQKIYANRYAQALYLRAQDEINPRLTPLPGPQLRTPIYRSKTTKDVLAKSSHLLSASLRNLFNDIKRRSTQEEDSPYIAAHIEQHFDEEDPNIAVVLSRAENNGIFTLTEDQRLEV